MFEVEATKKLTQNSFSISENSRYKKRMVNRANDSLLNESARIT